MTRHLKYRKPKLSTVFLPTNLENSREYIEELKCMKCNKKISADFFKFSDKQYVKTYKGKKLDVWNSKWKYSAKINYCPYCGTRITKEEIHIYDRND